MSHLLAFRPAVGVKVQVFVTARLVLLERPRGKYRVICRSCTTSIAVEACLYPKALSAPRQIDARRDRFHNDSVLVFDDHFHI